MVARITRTTRVIMLLTSYLDARPGLLNSGSGENRKPRGSSTIPRMGDLWSKGSYAELEEAMNELSLVSAQRIWRAYIWQPDRRRRNVQSIYRQKSAKELARDVESLSRLMPRRITVPKDIIENWKDYGQEKSSKSADAPYTTSKNSRSAPAAPVQTGD
jgi:hypothetical protein